MVLFKSRVKLSVKKQRNPSLTRLGRKVSKRFPKVYQTKTYGWWSQKIQGHRDLPRNLITFLIGWATFTFLIPTLHITNTRFLHGSSVGKRLLSSRSLRSLLPVVVWRWPIGATTFGWTGHCFSLAPGGRCESKRSWPIPRFKSVPQKIAPTEWCAKTLSLPYSPQPNNLFIYWATLEKKKGWWKDKLNKNHP